MNETPRQLPLPFTHAPAFASADFLQAESNAEACAWLDSASLWPGGRLLVWGAEGCGKTHLLHRWARRAGAPLLQAWHLRGLPPPPSTAAIAVDDADAAAEETALLHLLNAAAEAGTAVLLTARTPPARWTTSLPDLASRLRAVTAVRIGPAEDSLLRALLASLLSDRQLAVAEPVQDWLLLHLPRTPAALREAVARLDHASLADGGRVTRRLAGAVLADLLATP